MSMKKTNSKTKLNGQGMVEFAMVIPVLLLLMLTIVELGHMLFFYVSVYGAAREGARYGAAVEVTDGTPKYEDQPGIRAAAQRVGFIAGLADDQIDILYDCGVSTTKTGTVPNCTTGMLRVSVSVNSTYESIVPIPAIPVIPISSTVVRTVVDNVGIEGNYPTRPAPTNTPAPNCAELVVDQQKLTGYPNWHVVTIVAGEQPVTLNTVSIDIQKNGSTPKRDLQWILLDPSLTSDPNPDNACHDDLTGCVLWFYGNSFSFDTTMNGTTNLTKPIPLDGRRVDDTMRTLFIRFKDTDYQADVTINSWCGNNTVTIKQ